MIETIQWTGEGVVMIDQTLLPNQQEFFTCRDYKDVAHAIRTMVIRGAPAIGVSREFLSCNIAAMLPHEQVS